MGILPPASNLNNGGNMKKLMIVAALFAANTSFACPDLAGNYVCADDGQAKATTITQAVSPEGVVSYAIAQENDAWSPIVADGVERDFVGIDAMKEARYAAVCEGDILNVAAKGKVMDNGTPIGDLALRIKVSRDAAGNLLQNINGTLSGEFGEFPIDEQNNTCTRQ